MKVLDYMKYIQSYRALRKMSSLNRQKKKGKLPRRLSSFHSFSQKLGAKEKLKAKFSLQFIGNTTFQNSMNLAFRK